MYNQCDVEPPAGPILRQLHAALIGAKSAIEISLQVVGEAEVIPDIRLQRTDRRIARVGQSIRLDLIRFSF